MPDDSTTVQNIHIANPDEIGSPKKKTHDCENIELLTNMRIEMAEMSRDMVHFAACFQELNAQLTEFMQKQDERIGQITNNCVTRAVKWEDLYRDLDGFKRAQKDIYKRIEVIEQVHSEDVGGKRAIRPLKDYIVYVFMCATSILLLYLFAIVGIKTV